MVLSAAKNTLCISCSYSQTVLWIDLKFWILSGNCYVINILKKKNNTYIQKYCKDKKNTNNILYNLFKKFLRVLTLNSCFGMIF